MAKGNNKAHSNQRRPGKSNRVTAVALTKPTLATPTPTHKHNHTVVQAYSGKTVWAICDNTSAASWSQTSQVPPKDTMGTVNISAKAMSKKGNSQRNMVKKGGMVKGCLTKVNPNENCTYLQ
jgi:hypothetical protein